MEQIQQYLKDKMTFDQILGWVSMILLILATGCTAFDVVPANKIFYFIGSITWAWVGFLWRQPSLWALNSILTVIYIVGYFH
jgi:hypothetical protein